MASPQLEDGYLKIANELWDALTRYRIPGEQRQCLDFILRKTYGWGKKMDVISLSQFVKATGMGKPHILRATYTLRDKNIIVIKKDNGIVSYGINKDFDSWEPLSKRVTTFIPETTLKKHCYICGFKEVYERHYIIPRKEGGANKNSNILHACPNCHSLIHKGKYSQKDLLPIKITVETVSKEDNGFGEKGKKPLSKKVPTKDSLKDNTKETISMPFSEAWEKYPAGTKGSKQEAMKSWKKTKGKRPDNLIEIFGIQKAQRDKLRAAGEFVAEWKYFSTYLNQACWEETFGKEEKEDARDRFLREVRADNKKVADDGKAVDGLSEGPEFYTR